MGPIFLSFHATEVDDNTGRERNATTLSGSHGFRRTPNHLHRRSLFQGHHSSGCGWRSMLPVHVDAGRERLQQLLPRSVCLDALVHQSCGVCGSARRTSRGAGSREVAGSLNVKRARFREGVLWRICHTTLTSSSKLVAPVPMVRLRFERDAYYAGEVVCSRPVGCVSRQSIFGILF